MSENASENNQITLTIRWFSVLAERREKREESISIPQGWTGNDLLNHLAEDFDALDSYRENVRLAVNHEFTPAEHTLQHGDEVAFITPVSGG